MDRRLIRSDTKKFLEEIKQDLVGITEQFNKIKETVPDINLYMRDLTEDLMRLLMSLDKGKIDFREIKDVLKDLPEHLEKARKEIEKSTDLTKEQKNVLKGFLETVEREMIDRTTRTVRGPTEIGVQNISRTLYQIGRIPGLEPIGMLARLIPGGLSVGAIAAVIGAFIENMDKLIDAARRTRQTLTTAGAETIRLSVMGWTQLNARISYTMRVLTDFADSGKVAMQVLSQFRQAGAFQEITISGMRVVDMMRELEESGGALTEEMGTRLGMLAARIRNLAVATGSSEQALIRQAMSLSRYTTTQTRDLDTLLFQWYSLARTANEARISIEDYVKWVMDTESKLRFFGFTIDDVNGVAYQFKDQLRTGVVSLENMSRTIEQMLSARNLTPYVLFLDYVRNNIGELEKQNKAWSEVRDLIERASRGPGGLTEFIMTIQNGQTRTAEMLRRLEAEYFRMGGQFLRGVAGPDLYTQIFVAQRMAQQIPWYGPLGSATTLQRGLEQMNLNLRMMTDTGEKGKQLQEEAVDAMANLNENFRRFSTIGEKIGGGFDWLKNWITGNSNTVPITLKYISPDVKGSLILETGR